MFEKTIEFYSSDLYLQNNKDILPTPSKINIPNWYKKLKHDHKDKTVKGCMPFLDTLTIGYILKMPIDYYVEHNVETEGIKNTGMRTSNERINGITDGLNLNFSDTKEFHSIDQAKESPHLEKNKNLPFHKILNPFIIKTPPGYSCLFVPPLNNSDDRFSIIPGIVDTDKYNLEVNFPIVFNGDKYDTLETTIKRGTPYVQVIPFKRDSWKMKIRKTNLKDKGKNVFKFAKYLFENYKLEYWSKKKCK